MMPCQDKRRLYARSDIAGTGAAVKSLVVGLGATGLSVARWLARHGEVARFADTRSLPDRREALAEIMPGADLRGGPFEASLLDGVARLIVSPGIRDNDPLLVEARSRGIPLVSDIDLFVSEARAPIAAVTGSNGKSTVVSLLAAMCERADIRALAGANLGTPALDLLTEPVPALYLLELSSFQLQRTARLPARVAAVLNVSPDHLDWHESEEAYARAKYRIYTHAETGVVNRAEPVPAGARLPEDLISFGPDEPDEGQYGLLECDGCDHLARGGEILLQASALKLRGRHNSLNVLAALAVGEQLGLPGQAMIGAAAAFPGLPHRAEFVAERDGVTWINDSKATNVGAAVAAIVGIDGPLVLIAGGDAKGASFERLREALRGRLRTAILLGTDADRLADVLAGLVPVAKVDDMVSAVRAAAAVVESGDTVLLAPACASTDMFGDYRERGNAFRAAVAEVLS